MIGLNIDAVGDLHVDAHHLVEDVGIVLGEALSMSDRIVVMNEGIIEQADTPTRIYEELDQLVVVRLRKVFVAHAVAAAALDVLPIPLGRLEIVLVVRLDPVKLAERLRLQLHRPRGKLLIRSALKPFVDILFRAFERRTLRMLLLDIAKEIFDVLPVAFICIYREDLILFRAGSHGFLFALAESQHLGQPTATTFISRNIGAGKYERR